MPGRLKIHLKANEGLFINGTLMRVDRKVGIELTGETALLLEAHVLAEDEATTPLRQLYLLVQSMLIEPAAAAPARVAYDAAHRALIAQFRNRDLLEGLVGVRELIDGGKVFDALKRLRALFAIECEEMADLHAGD